MFERLHHGKATGQTEKIVLYCKKVQYTPDYIGLLQHIMRTNPEKGAEFAAQLVNDENGPLVDVERVRTSQSTLSGNRLKYKFRWSTSSCRRT